MRERWSKILTVVTGALVLLLAYAVADLRNPSERAAASPAPPPQAAAAPQAASAPASAADASQASSGKKIYGREGCARCHSIAGEGSPRSPLDGVGERLSAEEIRKWIVAAPELEDELSGRVFRTKQAYGKLPEAELAALVSYLQAPDAASPQ